MFTSDTFGYTKKKIPSDNNLIDRRKVVEELSFTTTVKKSIKMGEIRSGRRNLTRIIRVKTCVSPSSDS